jgi:drug/metabolite transporter (DMT)-like permease
MTPVSLIIVLIALLAAVGGQLFLKKAMQSSHGAVGFRSRAVGIPFVIGIVLMTVQFFLNLGLLQRYDLSFIYPFQGLSVIIITFAAAFTLHEKLTLQLVAGSLLISVGVALVSLT